MCSVVVNGGTMQQTQKQKNIRWSQQLETNEEFTDRVLDALEARLEEILDQKIYALLD